MQITAAGQNDVCVCVGTNIHISSPSSLSPSLCCRYNQTEEEAWTVCLLICPTHPPLHRPAPLPSKSPRRRSSPVAGQSLTTRHLWWDSNAGHKKNKTTPFIPIKRVLKFCCVCIFVSNGCFAITQAKHIIWSFLIQMISALQDGQKCPEIIFLSGFWIYCWCAFTFCCTSF